MKIRKSVALAGSAAALAAMTGLAAVPAFASGATVTHTLHFTAHKVAANSFGEVDKDTHAGKVIGYDALSYVASNRADVALSLHGGFLYGHFTISSSGALSGKVTGGAGAYKGDTGTIKGQGMANSATVTVTYHH
jgi:hypothetical protein